MTGRLAILVLAASMLTAACTADGLGRLANFVDVPFVDGIAEVQDLDGATLEPVLSDVLLRFRAYVDLRAALPFASLTDDQACFLSSTGGSSDFQVSVDVACLLGDETPAAGVVTIAQRESGSSVVDIEVTYDAVQVGDLRVDGREDIVETLGAEGTSVRTLDLVQDDIVYDYSFRIGALDPETPVFDYEVELPGGAAQVRLMNPATVGAFASVLVTGIDGSLACEIRDAAWEPGDPAKGTCDNGAYFGL